jgi:hypothetical protein
MVFRVKRLLLDKHAAAVFLWNATKLISTIKLTLITEMESEVKNLYFGTGFKNKSIL